MAKQRTDNNADPTPEEGTQETVAALAAAPSHGQLREWHDQRRKEFTDARSEYDAAEKADKLDDPELLSKQRAHMAAIEDLDAKLSNGLMLMELHRVEDAGADLARRMASAGERLGAAAGADFGGPGLSQRALAVDPSADGPGRAAADLSTPSWYDEISRGVWDGEELSKYSGSDEHRETLAQQVHDGPRGGYQVPTLHVRGLHRVYPYYRLEGLVRSIFVMDYSDVDLDAITGFAMQPAVYLAPGAEAPQRDYKEDRRLLTPIRQTALNIMDRPMNRLSGYVAQVEEEIGLQFMRSTEACLVRGPAANHAYGGSANLGPAGIFTTAPGGLPASRDKAGNNGNNGVGDVEDEAWIDARQHLKSEARMSPALRWVFHRTTMGAVMNLKGSDGHRLFRDALRVGEPDTLVGVPIVESEEAPTDYTAGKRIAVIGDFRNYVLIHWMDGAVIAFDASQHFATKGQTGTVYERYNHGAVMTSDAFACVTMGPA